MAKTKKKPSFNCDVNGGIMVTCAVRYALGRMTYVPSAIQEWIKTYWDSLDGNTKIVVVRDVFEYLCENYRARNDAQFLDAVSDYDASEWQKFGIDRYWALSYDERKSIDLDLGRRSGNSEWLKFWMPKLYDNHKDEL